MCLCVSVTSPAISHAPAHPHTETHTHTHMAAGWQNNSVCVSGERSGGRMAGGHTPQGGLVDDRQPAEPKVARLGPKWLAPAGNSWHLTNPNLFADSLSNVSYVHGIKAGTNDFVDRDLFELNETLRRQGRILYLYWIPSHWGIEGNERADELAKEGAEKDTPTFFAPTYATKIKTANRKAAWNEWKTTWRDSTTKRLFIPCTPNPDPAITDIHNNLTPQQSRWLTWFRSGHLPLNYMKAKWDATGRTSPQCACGAAEESRDHFLFACPRWQEHRDRPIEPLLRDGSIVQSVAGILSSPVGRSALFSFIADTRRFRQG